MQCASESRRLTTPSPPLTDRWQHFELACGWARETALAVRVEQNCLEEVARKQNRTMKLNLVVIMTSTLLHASRKASDTITWIAYTWRTRAVRV